MKKSTLWILSTVAVAALVAGGARWASQRQTATAPTASTAAALPRIELAASDVFTARTQTISLGIAVSGALKATQSAIVKARVAGEQYPPAAPIGPRGSADSAGAGSAGRHVPGRETSRRAHRNARDAWLEKSAQPAVICGTCTHSRTPLSLTLQSTPPPRLVHPGTKAVPRDTSRNPEDVGADRVPGAEQ